MTYQQKQFDLFEKIEKSFKKGESPSTIVEPVKDYVKDNRICLTAAVFMSPDIQRIIETKVIKPLKEADGSQYYYLPESLHLTIQSVRTSHHPPEFTHEDIKKVRGVLDEIIPKHKKLNFNLKGLFELPTSLGIRAFSDASLTSLVSELREKLQTAGVPDNKTYASNEVVFGNVTVCRYKNSPKNSFQEKVSQLKDVEIGQLRVKNISLITTNPVCHPKWTKILGGYSLKT